jgi:hypothetical protein
MMLLEIWKGQHEAAVVTMLVTLSASAKIKNETVTAAGFHNTGWL